MPPHGPGVFGGGHSHDPEFPDDDWNLYSMLDTANTTGLNVSDNANVLGVFKPHVLRLNDTPFIMSDADAEVMIIARFTSPVLPRKFMFIGGGTGSALENHPRKVKVYVNQENLDFTNTSSRTPAEEFDLLPNPDGTLEVPVTKVHLFNNVVTLTFYISENVSQDEDTPTYIKYIGIQGDHTHHRREAVHATYELLCTGAEQHTDHGHEADVF